MYGIGCGIPHLIECGIYAWKTGGHSWNGDGGRGGSTLGWFQLSGRGR